LRVIRWWSRPLENAGVLGHGPVSGLSCGVVERTIDVEIRDGGHAYVKLGDAEVRDSVELSEHDEADRIPTLDSLTLHFDFYGRLTAIEITGAVGSVLPPALIDED
jgi:hypothetical protein